MHLARKPFATLVASVLALALPAGVTGQDRGEPLLDERAGGSWWSVSLSAASARLTCDLCQSGRDLGPSLDVVVGASAGPDLRFGLEGGLWVHDAGEVRESVYRAGLLAQLHPRPGSGLHLSIGAGWSGYRAEGFAYDAARLTLGAGWDFPLRGRWVVGNSVTLDAASFGSLRNESAPVARDVGLSVVRVGFYVRRH